MNMRRCRVVMGSTKEPGQLILALAPCRMWDLADTSGSHSNEDRIWRHSTALRPSWRPSLTLSLHLPTSRPYRSREVTAVKQQQLLKLELRTPVRKRPIGSKRPLALYSTSTLSYPDEPLLLLLESTHRRLHQCRSTQISNLPPHS